MNTILIQGKSLPIRFSIRALMEFEEKTGIKIAELSKGISIAAVVHLALCALKDGARKEKTKLNKEFDFDWLVDRFDESPELINDFVQALTKSQNQKKRN